MEPGTSFRFTCLRGQELRNAREHQFLAASDSIDFTFERVQGAAHCMLFGGTGFFIDKFHAVTRATAFCGCMAMEMSFEKVLGPGEIIDIEPGGWLYKDPSVRMETVIDKLTSGLFGGFNLIVNPIHRTRLA